MSALNNLETKLNDVFVKNAPFQIPENGRKWIATYAWVFALIGLVLGVLQLLQSLPCLVSPRPLRTLPTSVYQWKQIAILPWPG